MRLLLAVSACFALACGPALSQSDCTDPTPGAQAPCALAAAGTFPGGNVLDGRTVTDGKHVWMSIRSAGATFHVAAIADDGSLQAFEPTAAPPGDPVLAGLVLHEGVLYAVGGLHFEGGFGESKELTAVHYARPDANGKIGAWTATTQLPEARWGHAALVTKGRLYLVGGATTSAPKGSVAVSSIDVKPDGSLGATWRFEKTLKQARVGSGGFVSGDWLVMVGGSNTYATAPDKCSTTEIVRARVQTGGALGEWQSARSYPGSRSGHSLFFADDEVFIAGGVSTALGTPAPGADSPDGGGNGGSPGDAAEVPVEQSILSAPVVEGEIGDWVLRARLPSTRHRHALVVTRSALHVLGGHAPEQQPDDQILRAKRNPDGSLSCGE